jgi:hypothetical protein
MLRIGEERGNERRIDRRRIEERSGESVSMGWRS